MGFGIEMLVAIMIFLGGARNDLLDLIPTNSYWQAKKVAVTLEQLQRDAGPDQKIEGVEPLLVDLASPEFKVRNKAKASLESMGPSILLQLKPALSSANPEVKAVAAELTIEFEGRAKERAIRRLMAIRTLGERKEKEALPLLKTLVDSKEVFVSEYAARAAAAVENKSWLPADRSKAIQPDLQLLPRHTGILGQTLGIASTSLDLPTLIDTVYDPNAGPAQPGEPPPTKAEALERATAGILQIAERIGNFRLDGLTVGLSDDAGENSGWEIIILRGQYDRAALLAASKVLAHPVDGPIKFFQLSGIDVVQTDVDTSIMFPSDQMAIIVMADEEKDRTARMTALIDAMKTGQGTLKSNAEITALLKTIDTAAPVWLAGKLNAEEQKEKLLEGVDSFTLVGKRDKDSLAVTLHSEGSDPEKIKSSVDELNADIQTAKQAIPPGKSLAPIAGLLNSLHVAFDAKSATLTGQLKADLPGAVVINVLSPLVELKVPQENNPPPQPLAVPAQ